ncbi:uncharacterized protein N7459_002163 [Penicillium hispanicum]|uniref:uncharacterized protein n=1 Tax=Penicillium hispanicum TaxID=1080232 RepID=UPI002541FB2B|nr:uncharacterized protein N7459_002163 [Penicillium hispanicum]KAJ5591794.1 hypothetical protein N7459_002163 [Penicillium hispanicum]
MADDTPVTAPAEQPEHTSAADKPADKEPENVTTSDSKPADDATATIENKEPEGEADNAVASGETTESKGENEAAAPEANGTPASAKKSSKDRRRSSGVNDKKLNRKKSQTRMTNIHAKPGEYYLARLRSYAPWPAIICDEEMLPQSLLDSRPVTAMQKDGTYREEYAEEGKRAHERTFPVMFFQTNEFAWIVNSQLTPLDPAECKDVSEKNKSKQLIGAYKVAAEAHDLQYFKNLLSDHQAALQQEIEEQEAEEAAKAAAKAEKEAKKGNRKSKGAETDVDMEDAEESKKSKTTKKRKKTAEADGEAEKPSKTPKTAPKLKLTSPKAPATENGKKTPASKAKKATTKKGKAAASEDETAAEPKEPEKQVDPEELKKKKEKEVLFLRHKLQKGFISRDQPPKEDEMATMATYFDKLEKHADLEVSIIRSTKINKVLKMIVKLNSIPRDEEFNFRHRSVSILSSWKAILDSDAPGASGDKEAKPTANGANKDEETVETPKQETEEEKESETKAANDDTPMPDADAAEAEAQPEEADKATDKETGGDKPAEQVSEEAPAEEKTVEASA